MSVLLYWNSLELELKMTSAMSQSHSTLSSIAFFISPFLRLVNVTCTRGGKIYLPCILVNACMQRSGSSRPQG